MAELDRAARLQREIFLRVLTPTKPPPQVARQLAQSMTEVRLGAGQTLYARGDRAEHSFFIVEGQLVARAPEEADWPFTVGDVLGVLDLNLERPRSRTVVATTDVVLLRLPFPDWLEVLEENPEFASSTRAIVTGGLHDLILKLAPDGGFPTPEPPDPDVVGVVEGTMVDRMVAMRGCSYFEKASVQATVELAGRGDLVRAEKGDIVLRPGGAKRRIYLVMDGLVHVERRVAPEIQATFGSSDLILGGAAFSGALDEYAVSALSDVLILSIRLADLDDVVEDHFDLSRAILRGMSAEREARMGERARRARDRATV